MFSTQLKMVLACVAIFAVTVCCSSEARSQGFRIGNFMQAGGGQGFRMGGPRFGMHFGGGQGASIGGQNVGMRFGNGQGARFGGVDYGMQFGGGQGTQIGQLNTTPMVTPGTYYYGDVRQSGYVQPVHVPQPNYSATVSPTIAQPLVAQPNYSGTVSPTIAQPSVASATDYESQVNTTAPPASDLNGYIRLSHPADADESIAYRLNGTEFKLEPGTSILMASGQEWNVEFSSGEGLGDRQAKLSESGTFQFSKTPDEGWVLVENETIARLPTQVANPPSDETSPFDNPAESEQRVLIDDVAPVEAPSVEADDATDDGAEDPAEDPNEVPVAPADAPAVAPADDDGK